MTVKQTEASKIAAKLTPPMIQALVHFYCQGTWGDTHVGTTVALLDRKLVGHARPNIRPDVLTSLGREVLRELVEAAHAEALETAKTRLDIADFDEEAVYAQAAAERENIDCPPVCAHGNTADQGCLSSDCATHVDSVHPIALEHAEIIAFEQNFFDGLIGQGVVIEDALDITSGLRAVDAAWGNDSAETARYDELLRKHAGTVPFVIKH